MRKNRGHLHTVQFNENYVLFKVTQAYSEKGNLSALIRSQT